MSLRQIVASLALVPVLGAPSAAQAAMADGPGVLPQRTHFDLQAHRGGIGMTTEESLEGFGKAMRLGVTTLELDTQITKDEMVVVTHDRQINPQKCRDTAPVTAADSMYPYVGKYIKDLTLAEIKTMDCGYQQLPGFPAQEQVKGFRMVELKNVLNLVKSYRGLKVIPWTCDDPATVEALMDMGVDGIITNYPNHVRHHGRSRYATAEGVRAALTPLGPERRSSGSVRSAIDERGGATTSEAVSSRCVALVEPVAQVSGETLEEDFVSPLAGKLQIFGRVAVLAKAVLDEHSL